MSSLRGHESLFSPGGSNFLDALASLELVMTVTGSQIFFREILDQSVNKTFRQTDLKTIQPYNLTT